jgi:hypothetical protein
MSAIKLNYSNVGGGQIAPGEYEVIVKGASFHTTKKGVEIFSIPLTVRNDVDQKYKNFTIWDGIFALHSDKAIGFKVNNIGNAVKLPEGSEFEDLDEWGKAIMKKPMRVRVIHDEDFGGRASVTNYSESRFPQVNHTEKEKVESPYLEDQPSVVDLDVTPDDCPF